MVANIGTLVEGRAPNTPVIWVQHSSEDLGRAVTPGSTSPSCRADSEPLVHKTHGDSFEDTDLEEELASAGVGRLVVTGAQTDACIRSTIHGAFVRGYDTVLVGDAHTTDD